MRKFRRPKISASAELDITSFMNLMIILVPVLLMSMVFTHTTVLKVTLPSIATVEALSDEDLAKPLEVIVRANYLDVNYPAGTLLQRIENSDGEFDLAQLATLLQTIKQTLAEQSLEKRDITLLLEPEIDYQQMVSVMDAVRSYKAVVVASLVDAELFPDIALGTAPQEPAS